MTVRVSTTNISCKKIFQSKANDWKECSPTNHPPFTLARKGLGKCVQTVSNTCSWPGCCLFLDTMENSNEQPCVCLYQRQAPHECRAMHAGMHHARSKLRTSVRQCMQPCIVRVQAAGCGVHFWFALRLWTAFGQGRNKGKETLYHLEESPQSVGQPGDADVVFSRGSRIRIRTRHRVLSNCQCPFSSNSARSKLCERFSSSFSP